MPEQILWLVDEYVAKSESTEGVIEALERAMRRASYKEANQLTPAGDKVSGCSQIAA